jgi:hypothetical protein
MLSTAGHCDQSRLFAMIAAPSFKVIVNPAFQAFPAPLSPLAVLRCPPHLREPCPTETKHRLHVVLQNLPFVRRDAHALASPDPTAQ